MVLRPDVVQDRLFRLEEVQLGAEILFEIGQHILSARFALRVLENLARAPADFGDFIAAIRRWLVEAGTSS